eukprot:TRINITY_DN6304_c0_g1_i8.p1 TRINITY_DN6304_c0_g1~~TRINITY_DN6304_c0_g1_i8.p1  ORF type:complete len:103 (+),score=14.02 TRINITY_DN6304_c0_g1_i8:74-382(+)
MCIRDSTYATKLKLCFGTMLAYIDNLISKPSEVKFRRINMQNLNFRERVGDMMGPIAMFEEVGFIQESGGFLQLVRYDYDHLMALKECLQYELYVLELPSKK